MRESKANDEEKRASCPSKKIENSSTEKCFIHCSKSNENLTKLQSYKSWKVLLDAAKIRQHQAVLEKAPPVPENALDILYHRKCRSIFTLKDILKQIQEQEKVWCTSLNYPGGVIKTFDFCSYIYLVI